jgi:hypothetical protein
MQEKGAKRKTFVAPSTINRELKKTGTGKKNPSRHSNLVIFLKYQFSKGKTS